MSFARTGLERWRIDRARLIARPAERLLPLEEAPRTSRDLTQAVGLVRRDRRAAVELCQLLLLTYVLRLEWSERALDELERLVLSHHLPADTRQRIEHSALPLARFLRFGPQIRALEGGGSDSSSGPGRGS